MALTSGTKLGPYEIQAPLGAGGMGEVYRAHDVRLDRSVAIKVLPESFAKDTGFLQRFEQEARVLSALSHPNLLAIYDVGAERGINYLVSEFLEGQTLRERMTAGDLPQRKIPEYALQIANGLAAAHEKGIVHRDLKPENIFITRDERVKILDFGLAKQVQTAASITGESATLGGPSPTSPGTVLGTAGYMSPEQVRGQTVDHRSDIFSFGTILYEMATGRRAFQGESAVETMNAILKDDPPEIDITQMKVSPGLERVTRHCLEKNPADRFQSARDLAFAIGALSGTETSLSLRSVPQSKKHSWLAWAAAVLALVAVALAFLYRPQAPAAERLEFAIPVPEELSHGDLALSPDGSLLAFVSPDETLKANMLTVQRIGSATTTVLPGTEGAKYPFWSPDNAYVAFFADGKLKKAAASGGATQILAIAPNPRGGTWGRRGIIIYQGEASGPLWRVNADGGNAARLTTKSYAPGEESHRWPLFLPDGDHFLFWAGNFSNSSDDRASGIYLSSLAAADNKTLLVLTRSNPGYASGYLYYLDGRKSLVATSVDISKGKVSGETRIVAEGVGFQASTYWGAFTVAENGTIVYSAGEQSALSVLTWFDRTGKELGHVGDAGVLANPSISPDGNSVAVDITDIKAHNVDVWIDDLKRGVASRFTFDPAEETTGIWSHSGNVIAFRSTPKGAGIFLKKAQGLEPQMLIANMHGDDPIPNAWSSDDQQILCTLQPSSGGSNLVLVAMSDGKITPFLPSQASQSNGQFSPDGKWVAYASNESGDWEIYVTTYPGAAGKWQVSRGGGIEPRWRGDGKEIFYIGPKSTLTAVPVNREGTFSSGTPMPLFQFHGRTPVSSTDLFTYDVAKDGKRFLVNRYARPEHIAPLNVVLNDSAEMRK